MDTVDGLLSQQRFGFGPCSRLFPIWTPNGLRIRSTHPVTVSRLTIQGVHCVFSEAYVDRVMGPDGTRFTMGLCCLVYYKRVRAEGVPYVSRRNHLAIVRTVASATAVDMLQLLRKIQPRRKQQSLKKPRHRRESQNNANRLQVNQK